MNFENNRILVVAAHPDDEVLGLGGTINLLTKQKNCIAKVIILGEGLTSRSTERNPSDWEEELKIHNKNVHEAAAIIGYSEVSTYGLPDNRFDTINLLDIIKIIEKEKLEFRPDVIFTHHGRDLNIDHQKTFEAVMTATRPLSQEIVNTVITFETPSSTEWRFSPADVFVPNLFIEIDQENLQSKLKAMECYEFEKRPSPHPRSTECLTTLAKSRGMNVGFRLAEAFDVIRDVQSL